MVSDVNVHLCRGRTKSLADTLAVKHPIYFRVVVRGCFTPRSLPVRLFSRHSQGMLVDRYPCGRQRITARAYRPYGPRGARALPSVDRNSGRGRTLERGIADRLRQAEREGRRVVGPRRVGGDGRDLGPARVGPGKGPRYVKGGPRYSKEPRFRKGPL